MPAATPGHPLATALLLRTLRLNCLTSAYATIWESLYRPEWSTESWLASWPGLPPLGDSGARWGRSTAFRTERERRAAMVEIDALVAVWLGMDVEDLIAILRSRYPILTGREANMWFDNAGRRIALDPYAFGHGQTKLDYEKFSLYREDPRGASVPPGFMSPFHKADREGEYRQAHAAFSKRLRGAIDAGWEPS